MARLDRPLAVGRHRRGRRVQGGDGGPSRDWVDIVATPRARNKIRQWFSRERREDAIESGRDDLSKALRREGLPVQKLSSSPVLVKLAESMNYADLDSLHAAIGEGHVSAQSIAQRLAKELRGGDHEEQLPASVKQPRRRSNAGTTGVHVEGLDDVMVRLSRCCTPVPGDEIIGFVTRGRGVSVHRSDCANAAALMASQETRLIEVEWDRERAWLLHRVGRAQGPRPHPAPRRRHEGPLRAAT